MKSVIVSFLMLSSITASANCLGEAQIIAKVRETNSCVATLDSQSIRHYSENVTCPLSLGDVLNQGIQDCTLRAGDTVNGVIVLTEDGKIIRD
jgi:hypothetical protein